MWILSHVCWKSHERARARAIFLQWWSLLQAVSTTFLLVCFVSLKESTCETRKNVFYFTSKALFVLAIIKFHFFQIFMKYSWDIHEMSWMMSSNVQAWITKHILFNNLRSIHSDTDIWLFYIILKKKNFYWKILWKMWPGKTSSRLFFIFKEPSVKRNLSRSTSWF